MNYKDICQEVAKLAQSTGEKLKEYRKANGLVIESKGHNDFVTQMDKYSEKLLVEGLEKILPEAGYITEESTRTDRGETYNWVVDPIDGTTNFIHNMPPYAISIGLMENERIVVGVVYELSRCELYSAWLGGGAYLNGEPIKASKAPAVGNALVATGFPYNNFDRMDGYMKSLNKLMVDAQGVRRIGSAATDLAYTAAGRFDVFYEYDLKPYDVAAGSLLVTEAGGKVCDFNGNSNYLFGREIVASNGILHDEFMQIIKDTIAE